jgi:hypothetical protein
MGRRKGHKNLKPIPLAIKAHNNFCSLYPCNNNNKCHKFENKHMRLRTCNRNLIDEMNSDKNLDIFS